MMVMNPMMQGMEMGGYGMQGMPNMMGGSNPQMNGGHNPGMNNQHNEGASRGQLLISFISTDVASEPCTHPVIMNEIGMSFKWSATIHIETNMLAPTISRVTWFLSRMISLL
jgi:hypothetical protein